MKLMTQKMCRFKQLLSLVESLDILSESMNDVFALNGDEVYLYAEPVSYAVEEELSGLLHDRI